MKFIDKFYKIEIKIFKFLLLLAFLKCTVLMITFFVSLPQARIWHVKSAGTGTTAEGTTWTNALNCDSMIHVLENDVSAGDIFFVKDSGTLTLTENLDCSARDGMSVAAIFIIGVKGSTTHDSEAIVYSDWAVDSADFPFFDCASYAVVLGDHYYVYCTSWQGDAATLITQGSSNLFFMGKLENDYGSPAARYCIGLGAQGKIINSYLTSQYASLINFAAGHGNTTYNCVLYGASAPTGGVGINCGSVANSRTCGNIFYKLRIAINQGTNYSHIFLNNTFFGCSTAVSASTGYASLYVNNILDSCRTDGFKWTTMEQSNLYWANHGDDARNNDMWDGVDSTSVGQDFSVTTGDPLFTNPAAYDFTLQAGSPCLNTGTEAP